MVETQCPSQIENSHIEHDFRVLRHFLNSLVRQTWHTPLIFFLPVESSCAWGFEDLDAVGCTYGFIARPKKLSIATFVVNCLMICGLCERFSTNGVHSSLPNCR